MNHSVTRPTGTYQRYQRALLFCLLSTLWSHAYAEEGVTFAVNDDVIPATEPLSGEEHEDRIERLSYSMLQAAKDDPEFDFDQLTLQCCSNNLRANASLVAPSSQKVYCSCNFVSTIMLAYNTHRPVTITPDAVWMTILQGVTRHLHADSEKYRHLFVEHEHKRVLEKIASPEDIGAFTDVIHRNIKDKALRDTVTTPFSTSSKDDQLAFGLTLMSMVKHYFQFQSVESGIPKVTLEGTVADWQAVKDRAQYFQQYQLGWWLDAINPILDQFIETSQHRINKTFWRGMVKYYPANGASGSVDKNNGWLINFFPYMDGGERPQRNAHLLKGDLTDPKTYNQPNYRVSDIPQTFSRVTIRDGGDNSYRRVECGAGVLAVQQDEQLRLKPVVGWVMFKGTLGGQK